MLAFAVVAVVVVGCGRSDRPPAYTSVSGTVTYNDKPIDKGQISFEVEGLPPVAIDVIDGKFSGQAMSGNNKVSVLARKKGVAVKQHVTPEMENRIKQMSQTMSAGSNNPPTDVDPTLVDYIPSEWGANSKQFRVVDPSGANVFKFDIHGK